MPTSPDFADLLPLWRAQTETAHEGAGAKLTEDAKLAEDLRHLISSEPLGAGAAPSVTLTRKLTALLLNHAERRVVPACLDWLEAQGLWRSPDLKAVAAADIKRALSVLLSPSFHHPAARVTPAPLGWLLVVAFGAVAGGVAAYLGTWAFALPPDDSGRRAVMSSALAAGVVAALTSRALGRPAQRAAFEAAANSRGFFRRRRAIKAALVQAGDAGSPLLPLIFFYLLRPRAVPPSIEDRLISLQRQFSRECNGLRDLVLAFCLTHPDCRGDSDVAKKAEAEPVSLFEAVGGLEAALALEIGRDEELREAAEELLQRFEDEGFVWRQAPPDARFDDELAQSFRPYGLLESGQAVATRKPALYRHGKLMSRGILSARK